MFSFLKLRSFFISSKDLKTVPSLPNYQARGRKVVALTPETLLWKKKN